MPKKEQWLEKMGDLASGPALSGLAQTVSQALEAVLAREGALPADQAAAPAHACTPELAKFSERLTELEHLTRRAKQNAEEVDAGLKRDEDHLRQSLATLEAMRQRLADWGGRAIG